MNIISALRPGKIHSALVAAASALLALSSPLAAATYTWDNGANTGLWGTAANWDTAPTFNNQADLIFDNASVVNPANAISTDGTRTIRSMTINADFNTLNNATFDIRTRTGIGGAGANLTFAANTGNASFTIAQSTSGTVLVRLGQNNVGSTILNTNLDLAQHNTFLNFFSFDGSVSGVGTINKTGLGEVRLVRNNTNWSGGLNINEGNVTIFNDANVMGTGTWTLGGGAANTSFTVGSSQTYNNAGGLVVAAGAGTRTIANAAPEVTVGNPVLSGAITLNKDATFAITQYTAVTHDSMTLSGTVTGTGGIVKTNTGILVLSADNSYGGTTTVSEGVLAIANDNALGSTNADTVVASGAQLRLTNNVTVGNEALTISGTGLPAGDGAAGALRNESGDNTWGGLITLVANAIIEALTGTRLTLDVASGDAINLSSFTATFSGGGTHNVNDAIGGTGGLTKAGTGTLHLAGSNRFTGGTAVTGGVLNLNSSAGSSLESTASISVTNATLLISQSDQVNDSATVTLSGGTIQREAGVSEVFGNLNLTTASFLDFGSGGAGTVSFGAYTPSALTALNIVNFTQGNTLTFGSDLTTSIETSAFVFSGNGGLGSYSWDNDTSTFTITAIPEPSTYLAAAGLLAVLMWPSRRRLLKDTKSVLGLRRPMRDRLG